MRYSFKQVKEIAEKYHNIMCTKGAKAGHEYIDKIEQPRIYVGAIRRKSYKNIHGTLQLEITTDTVRILWKLNNGDSNGATIATQSEGAFMEISNMVAKYHEIGNYVGLKATDWVDSIVQLNGRPEGLERVRGKKALN